MLLNCDAGEDSWESCGWPEDQTNHKEINSEYSLEGLVLKWKLQYFGHLMGRADSLEETLMLGKTKGNRRRQQRMRWLAGILTQWTWVWGNSRKWSRREARCAVLHGAAKSWTWLSDWTTSNCIKCKWTEFSKKKKKKKRGTDRQTHTEWLNRLK